MIQKPLVGIGTKLIDPDSKCWIVSHITREHVKLYQEDQVEVGMLLMIDDIALQSNGQLQYFQIIDQQD